MLYTTVSRILCPQNEDHIRVNHSSMVFVEISTSNNQPIEFSIQLQRVTNFILEYIKEKKKYLHSFAFFEIV